MSLFFLPVRPILAGQMAYTAPPSAHYFSIFYCLLIFAVVSPSMGSIFTEWDPVMSWNRWGIELSNNLYQPLKGGAYPVLWPALWSLIYEAQETTSYWMITKASLIFPVVFSGVYFAGSVLGKRPLSNLLFVTLAFVVLIYDNQWLLSGHMDIIVSLMGMIALLLLLQAFDHRSSNEYHSYMMLSVVSVSMAMVTKQAGVFYGAVIGIFIFLEFFNKRITFKRGVLLAIIMIIPLCLYLNIYLQIEDNIMGNFDTLRNQSANLGKGRSGWEIGRGYFTEVLPSFIGALVLAGAFFNILFIRTLRGVFGITLLLISFLTFLIYTDCCTYNERNLYPTIAMLLVSMFIGVSNVEMFIRQKRPKLLQFKDGKVSKYRPLTYLLLPIFVLAGVSLAYDTDKALEQQKSQQITDMGLGPANRLLYKEIPNPNSVDYVVSHYQLVRFLPGFEGKLQLCQTTTASCLTRVFAKEKAQSIVILTSVWNETDKSRAFMKTLEDEGFVTKTAIEPGRQGPKLLWLDKQSWQKYLAGN